jgi:hypothetical protein
MTHEKVRERAKREGGGGRKERKFTRDQDRLRDEDILRAKHHTKSETSSPIRKN